MKRIVLTVAALLWAVPALAVSVNQQSTVGHSTACTTTGVTTGNLTVTSGNVLVAICGISGAIANGDCVAPTDTLGSTWHQIVPASGATNSQCKGTISGISSMWWASANGSGTDAVKEISTGSDTTCSLTYVE